MLNGWLKRLKRVELGDTLHKLRRADVLLFCHDADRGATLDGKAYAPLIDSVREDLVARGYSCEVVALQWSRLVGDRAHGDPKAMNGSYLRASLALKLGTALGRFSQYKEPLIGVFADILAKARPRCVISIGSSAEMAIACKRAGVRHVELLHGLGYSIIPWNWERYSAENLPSDILSLDATSTATFEPLTEKGVRIHQIPHPFLKRFVGEAERANLPSEWLTFPEPDATGFPKRVLVALNWGYAGDHGHEQDIAGLLPNGLFPDELVSVIDYTAKDTLWSFRFHPVQLRQRDLYAALFKFIETFCAARSNAEWSWASSVPLPIALGQATAMVTMQSMSAYEAAAMGVPTLALCPTLRRGGKYEKTFEDLVAAGYVTKSDWSRPSISAWLSSREALKPLPGWRGDESAWERVVTEFLSAKGASGNGN